jgi:hypothetical protein
VIISPAFKVIPRVIVIVEFPGTLESNRIALLAAAAAPFILTKILAVAEDAVVFAMAIVEVTDCVKVGTVYKLALLVFAGDAWPRIL